MPVSLTYPHTRSGACSVREAREIWAVAGQFRRQIAGGPEGFVIDPQQLPDCASSFLSTGERSRSTGTSSTPCTMILAHRRSASVRRTARARQPPMSRSTGRFLKTAPTCCRAHPSRTRPCGPGCAGCAWLRRSQGGATVVHGVGRWTPSQQQPERVARERVHGRSARAAVSLHRELLRHARSEELMLVRAPHCGRPTWPVLDGIKNDPDAVAGVIDVVAQEFGVSPRFIEVRLDRYGLIYRGRKGVVS